MCYQQSNQVFGKIIVTVSQSEAPNSLNRRHKTHISESRFFEMGIKFSGHHYEQRSYGFFARLISHCLLDGNFVGVGRLLVHYPKSIREGEIFFSIGIYKRQELWSACDIKQFTFLSSCRITYFYTSQRHKMLYFFVKYRKLFISLD